MTLDQAVAFAIVIGMMALFVWGRIRYDLVALLALLACIVTGIVEPEKAFTGFSDDIVIIIASALLVSAAVARSGAVEAALHRLGPYLRTERSQIMVLVMAVTALSAFVKNIGALAMLIPVAFQIARRNQTPVSYFLMPMAFGSLLGGITTLVGTSPNIIVSRMREDLLGAPFRMFDFLPVGTGIAVVGVIFLVLGYRLLPLRKGGASMDAAFNIENYMTEARLPADSSLVGKTVADLEALSEGEVDVTTIIRERFRRYTPSDHWTLNADDVLILEGEPAALERLVARARLKLVEASNGTANAKGGSDEIGVVEAVVTADSPLVDRSPAQVRLAERYELTLLAVSRSGARVTHRLRSLKFRPGDVIVLQGNLTDMPETLGELRCLPLAERGIQLGRGRHRILPVAVLAISMLLVALHIVPVVIAFFSAAVLLVLLRALSLREAYDVIEWPILILVGALIPVSEAIRTTGGTDLIAAWLSSAAGALPPLGALALILVAAMAITPFLNNAATVLVVAPIAASMATNLGFNPDPFLMAVAIGAGCDFLTPIGHQCNTLVMGPGGYRFEDYWRLGLPLSILVVLVGVPLIALIWPLSG
ncbi:SLC13 family permease [Rhodoligotrophos ferricapiens]|uniref:SLC13 family permease n=1 Tax=Rhodoligotrophos ferricapiens TaxID=3069264 RepID=UPI00315DAC37